MTSLKKYIGPYVAEFSNYELSLNGQKDSALHQIRRAAISDFEKTGFPTTRDEEWRFTNLDPMLKNEFTAVVRPGAVQVSKDDVKPFLYENWSGPQLVFVDGLFVKELSEITSLSNGVQLLNAGDDSEKNADFLSDSAVNTANAFSSLNTAFAQDGLVLNIAKNTDYQDPVHLLFVATDSDTAAALYARNRISVSENSRATVIENYVSLGNNTYSMNAVSEIKLEANAELDYYQVQNSNLNSFHMGNVYIHQDNDSRFYSHVFTLGGALVRNNLNARLMGHNVQCTLNGLYMGHKDQHIDNHTFVDHAMPHCESHELYQGVLTDKARGVFSGKILVQRDAQKTDAKQSNNCLLLSDDSKVDSKPQLEIYADDVKCTHGATIGQLDEEALFYLRSRGISRQRAKNLLTYAFAERVIENIKFEQLRDYVDTLLLERFREDMQFVK